jgi:serine/threonine protein kinase
MSRSFVDFDELRELYRGESALVYRALGRASGRSVVLKTTAAAFPSEMEIAMLRHEYELLASRRIAGIVVAEELIASGHRHAIVFEDIGGESLAEAMQREPLTVDELYDLAISLSDALAQLHASGVIHKDISANNVVIDRPRGTVQLIDFDSATILTRENPHLSPITYAEGTLEYMAPEQTGRMNRTIDYRSDFYSLGATLYHAATGELPFDSTDPIELVHAHIAREPLSAGAHRPALPRSLVAIIGKLMRKNAEDRYQSAFGLKSDLERSRSLWRNGDADAELELGRDDFSGRLRISQKLYGREADVATMIAAFDECCHNRSAMVLLSGEPGIGKTSIAQEIFAPVAARRGFFASGKFDQLHRTVPYLPVMTAFGILVRQVLAESPERIERWRSELDTALGGAARVLLELVPELEMVIGARPAVPPLPAVESQNRLYHVCQRFVSVFARAEHPLVLFLDDLQWADLASLGLLRHILSSSTSSLLVIGAYRSTEVYDAHPAAITLTAITASGVPTTRIELAPLKPDDILTMVADTLDTTPERAGPLGSLVESKTAGNPFFANEFLKSIHDEGLIRADLEQCVWVWEIDELVARDMTDNVVELMVGRIERLPATTRRMLQYAACIGGQFDLGSLAVAGGLPPALAAIELREAIAVELIRPVGTGYRLVELATESSDELTNVVYRFAHDRIRQAAYSLIDEAERQGVHWRLGMLLHASVADEEITNDIFAIVNHLNLGYEVGRDRETALRIAGLNLVAGVQTDPAGEQWRLHDRSGRMVEPLCRTRDSAWSRAARCIDGVPCHRRQSRRGKEHERSPPDSDTLGTPRPGVPYTQQARRRKLGLWSNDAFRVHAPALASATYTIDFDHTSCHTGFESGEGAGSFRSAGVTTERPDL